MKLHLIDRRNAKLQTFAVTHNRYRHFLKLWHYHPELELVLIIKSSGTRFIGDSIEKFGEGEVVLIGKNLPHMWLNDNIYFDKSQYSSAEAIAIHFKKEFLGNEFLSLPELRPINELLQRAEQGIKFFGLEKGAIKKIKSLPDIDPFNRMIRFIDILNDLALHDHYHLLASAGYLNMFLKSENKRLHKIYEYVYRNFKESIGAHDVANIIGMNASSFSRFFKKIHRKTFTRYLNEIRIGYACKQLLEEKQKNIADIAYESGFNNISNFNRQFKLIMGQSPSAYTQKYSQNIPRRQKKYHRR